MDDPRWLDWAKRLNAIAQTGLTYATGAYDRERYEAICGIAAEMLAAGTGWDRGAVIDLFKGDVGYATPKVDVRAAPSRMAGCC